MAVSHKKRAQNWSEEDKCILTSTVLEKENILFGKFKGDRGDGKSITHEEKAKAWSEVLDAVNANAKEPRTLEQIRKQYDNIKQGAKTYVDNIKRPKTGGGPALQLAPSQRLYINSHDEAPHLVGLRRGLDTEDAVIPSTSTAEPLQSATEQIEVCEMEKTTSNENDVAVIPIDRSSRLKQPAKKRRREELEEEILQNELKKSQMELENVELKRKAAEKEIDAYDSIYNASISVKKYFDMKLAESFPFEI